MDQQWIEIIDFTPFFEETRLNGIELVVVIKEWLAEGIKQCRKGQLYFPMREINRWV